MPKQKTTSVVQTPKVDVVKEEPAKQQAKKHAQFILSKRVATAFTNKSGAAVCIADQAELAFAACGNTVKVYSLRTGIQTSCYRSARLLDKGVGVVDVHKANIVAMALANSGAQ